MADGGTWSPHDERFEGLRVRVERHRTARGDVAVVSLSGELDLEGASVVRRDLPADLADLLSPHAPRGDAGPGAAPGSAPPRVVADLAEVTFMDSSGLGVLLAVHRRLAEVRGSFSVCCAGPQVRQVLGITGADRVLSVHTDLHEALRSTPPGPSAA